MFKDRIQSAISESRNKNRSKITIDDIIKIDNNGNLANNITIESINQDQIF